MIRLRTAVHPKMECVPRGDSGNGSDGDVINRTMAFFSNGNLLAVIYIYNFPAVMLKSNMSGRNKKGAHIG